SNELGVYAKSELSKIKSSLIKEIRGKGLFIGIELTEEARPYCERLKNKGLLCKDTHQTVISLAKPLIIDKKKLNATIKKNKEEKKHKKKHKKKIQRKELIIGIKITKETSN